jgi:hypothetical protein
MVVGYGGGRGDGIGAFVLACGLGCSCSCLIVGVMGGEGAESAGVLRLARYVVAFVLLWRPRGGTWDPRREGRGHRPGLAAMSVSAEPFTKRTWLA